MRLYKSRFIPVHVLQFRHRVFVSKPGGWFPDAQGGGPFHEAEHYGFHQTKKFLGAHDDEKFGGPEAAAGLSGE